MRIEKLQELAGYAYRMQLTGGAIDVLAAEMATEQPLTVGTVTFTGGDANRLRSALTSALQQINREMHAKLLREGIDFSVLGIDRAQVGNGERKATA